MKVLENDDQNNYFFILIRIIIIIYVDDEWGYYINFFKDKASEISGENAKEGQNENGNWGAWSKE